ncbi:prolyl oligopeptidase family serine peptidase [Thermaurantiacus sp.]
MALMATTATAAPDPHLWLEEIEGEKALAWVRERNARSLPELESTPGFEGWRARAQEILEDPRRMAMPTGADPSGLTETRVFNFWRDARNVRGVWRVSPRADWEAGTPVWTTLLDLDALEESERRNWQWGGATCLPPGYRRCLVRLSVGGKDSVEVREFDTEARRFVPASEGGFFLPDAKQQVAFAHQDALLVATAAGPATTSGYAREARWWPRGTPFEQSRLLLTTAETDMGAWVSAYGEGEGRRHVIDRRTDFWRGDILHLMADWSLAPSPLPSDADLQFIANLGDGRGPQAFALLRSAFNGIPAGSLVAYDVPNGRPLGAVRQVFTPGPTQAIRSVEATGQALYIHLLDNVAARLLRLQPTADGWAASDIAVPANAAITLQAADSADGLAFTVSSFTTPDRLFITRVGGTPALIAENPAFFDGTKFEVAQRFARSKDGTRVPYFLVRPRAAKGPLKTLLFAYGGFEIPMVPAYLSPDLMMWLEAGNQYVLGNIRGGGEFGPRWHQAALREKRQNSYDDLHAIAETLKREKLASKIAVHGRSNGGLMASVAYTQRPRLYDAALVGVPLADMKRYHLLLAGASWMAEYGNPDTSDWEFIRQYSPYQNLRKAARYPRVFFYTSTKDDRVHPGHARKMAAEMEAQGHPFYYYENVDGGHAGVANLRESAYRAALFLAYLNRELK